MTAHAPIDRVSADDLMSLVGGSASSPMQVGAVLVLDAADGFDPDRAVASFDARVARVPRLHQRLVDVPVGYGRPIWVDDAGFRVADHVSTIACAGDEASLLEVAARLVNSPLDRSRPLWSATFVTSTTVDPGEWRVALVIVFHHVLADGIGGLAILAHLADGAAAGSIESRTGVPSRRALLRDAWSERLRAVRHLRGAARRVAAGMTELRSVRAVSGSLNVPTGASRLFETVSLGLAGIRDASHAHGATVNDAVLAAVAGSLHRLMERRGEQLDEVVISVPFSSRRSAAASELGNRSGVIPLRIPATGDPAARLEAVAAITRVAKRAPRAASTALLRPVFRGLDRIGAYRWFIDRQRMIHTIVSSVHGPESPISIAGCPVSRIVPLGIPVGNLPVTFTVLSYSGTLTITIVSDPDACPDVRTLRTLLVEELGAIVDLRVRSLIRESAQKTRHRER